jgi:hypothetical protein
MKVWRDRDADRLQWFVCKSLELNTKSPWFICLTEDDLLPRSIGREGLTLNRIWWGRGRTRTLVLRVGVV